jgi:hypothetical protein
MPETIHRRTLILRALSVLWLILLAGCQHETCRYLHIQEETVIEGPGGWRYIYRRIALMNPVDGDLNAAPLRRPELWQTWHIAPGTRAAQAAAPPVSLPVHSVLAAGAPIRGLSIVALSSLAAVERVLAGYAWGMRRVSGLLQGWTAVARLGAEQFAVTRVAAEGVAASLLHVIMDRHAPADEPREQTRQERPGGGCGGFP